MPRAILILFLVVTFPSALLAAEKTPRVLPYSRGNAAGWKAVIADYGYAPSFLLAVGKKDQRLSVFERRSPFAKTAEYDCSTGQNEGDKLVEGDLKTPEGVYFVVSHITSGLDYSLYGHEAYPLNYPNPVDRIRKKTGYGIWIHGKGGAIVPYDSNGCVGMHNNDIATLRQKPLIGQPVAMAVDIEQADGPAGGERAATAALLAGKVEAWAKAWSGRSAEMFDFYDPALYSLAQGQSFSAFKAQKERLFRTLPWISTSVRDIQIMEGPGYWVTWFNQDYKAPNLDSTGTRRLYWQAGADDELRIVGMEWLNGFTSPVLYADADARTAPAPAKPPVTAPPPAMAAEAQTARPEEKPKPEAALPVPDSPDRAEMGKAAREFIGAWQEAWKNRDLEAYGRCYDDKASQGAYRGARAILAHKTRLWASARVTRLDLSSLGLEPTKNGFKAVMRQDYADSLGYADTGVKILHLQYDGKSWRIVREDWKPLATQ